ncbi:MAG: peroxide stress protein YaaA [Erysipelotrichaceae bacterium]|nr:peroxide stress protein YaaA [Erysipelotrichaceae bacterium]
MKLIIAPAKKMRTEEVFEKRNMPVFVNRAEEIVTALGSLSYQQAKDLWACNDKIATVQYGQLPYMNVHNACSPAVFSYDGIQYKYMAPNVMSDKELDWLEDHLRILSGMYGILRPFDGILPYRLEMQAKLKIRSFHDLYEYWSDDICEELTKEDTVIINLASQEYADVIKPYLPDTITYITVVFAEIVSGKPVMKGTLAKMARGEMVRYLASIGAESPEQVKSFCQSGYAYNEELSDESTYVFIKKDR